MLKKLLLLVVISIIFFACGSNNETKNQNTNVVKEEISATPTVIAVVDFPEKASAMVGEKIALEGTVIHVCQHGGQKMFIAGDDPDIRVKIETGENMPAFNADLEGSFVKVNGTVAELVIEKEHEEGEIHDEDADHKNHYHKPQYSVICEKFTVEEK